MEFDEIYRDRMIKGLQHAIMQSAFDDKSNAVILKTGEIIDACVACIALFAVQSDAMTPAQMGREAAKDIRTMMQKIQKQKDDDPEFRAMFPRVN